MNAARYIACAILLGASLGISIVYGGTYALTLDRFPVEGYIGALTPLACVLMAIVAIVALTQGDRV